MLPSILDSHPLTEPISVWGLVSEYIPVDSLLFKIYATHVTLVSYKSLEIARRLGLSSDQQRFIEEAALLHDIGVCDVDEQDIGAGGSRPYIQHVLAGHELLVSKGYAGHGQVALTHTGVGITAQDVQKNSLELPLQDYLPRSLEEEIISYADLFFTKLPDKYWIKRTPEQVAKSLEKHGEDKVRIFWSWHKKYGETR